MTHKRSVIREAIRAQIGVGTPAGTNVFAQRPTELWSSELPAILIYVRDEESERWAENAPKPLRRKLMVAIEARAKQNDTLDDTLDAIAAEIEARMDSDHFIGDQVLAATLVSTQIDTGNQGEKPIGAIRLTYEILYQN